MSTTEVIAFYANVSSDLDLVPHYELLPKSSKLDISGCLLEKLKDYLIKRKNFTDFNFSPLRTERRCCEFCSGRAES